MSNELLTLLNFAGLPHDFRAIIICVSVSQSTELLGLDAMGAFLDAGALVSDMWPPSLKSFDLFSRRIKIHSNSFHFDRNNLLDSWSVRPPGIDPGAGAEFNRCVHEIHQRDRRESWSNTKSSLVI
jgi:hypothetical protein